MTDFLTRLFIKNRENAEDLTVREQYGKLSGGVGIVCNTILCLMKIISGIVFQSIAIVADGVNNLSDAANSLITLVGFRLAAKPADKDHPFGHARYEYISGLLVAFFIMMLGFSLLKNAITDIIHPKETVFSAVAVSVLVVSILLKLWLYFFNRKIAKKIDSVAIQATAQDSLNDVFSTSGVLISLLIGKLFSIQLDGYVGVLVSLLVLYAGFGLINETLSPLLGEAPKEELVKLIEKDIREFDKSIIGIHDLVVHNYGANKCFATVHVEVPASQSITVSHDIVDNIETHFRHCYHIQLVIHMDPVETDNPEVARLRNEVESAVTEISEELSIHDFRVAFGESHNNLIFDVVMPNQFTYTESTLNNMIQEKVEEKEAKSIKTYCVIQFDKRYT